MTIYSGFSHQTWWFSIVMLVYQRVLYIPGWWFGTFVTMEFYDFPYIGNNCSNHPNWRTHFFFRGVETTNQQLYKTRSVSISDYIRLYQWVYQTVSKYIRLYHHLLNLVFKISWPIWYIPWHSMTFQVLWSGFARAASARSRLMATLPLKLVQKRNALLCSERIQHLLKVSFLIFPWR